MTSQRRGYCRAEWDYSRLPRDRTSQQLDKHPFGIYIIIMVVDVKLCIVCVFVQGIDVDSGGFF